VDGGQTGDRHLNPVLPRLALLIAGALACGPPAYRSSPAAFPGVHLSSRAGPTTPVKEVPPARRRLLVAPMSPGVVDLVTATRAPVRAADLLLENGRFWTGEPDTPWTDAVAVLGDRILAVGSAARAAAGPKTRRIDLRNRLAVPGFIDNHTHFHDGSLGLTSLQLRDARTPQEFIRRIKEHAARLPAGAWLLEGNWDHENWGAELPTRSWIDSVTRGRPVFLSRLDGHMGLANSETLRIVGIDRRTPDPEGGTIVRDRAGEPTGILKDAAMAPVWPRIPPPTERQLLEAFAAGLSYAASEGVTSIQDMCYPTDVTLYQRLLNEGKLSLRVYCREAVARTADLAAVGVSAGFGGPWIKLGSIKVYVDGSLGSSTAAFFEPFQEEPQNRGLEMQSVDSLHRMLAGADSARIQLSVHAIGDRAISDLLDVFERLGREAPAWDRRWRVEHAQHIAPKDFDRFRDLDAIASMQPYHAIDDGRWAERKIGPERIKTTYAFRTLLDRGVKLTFGSDWPVAPISPIQGIYAAVTRRTLDGANPQGWVPEQKITLEEALTAYTGTNAYAAYEEDEKGRIAAGLLADVVVLNRNLFEIRPEEIQDVEVVLTIVGGRVVFERG
jgi:predicted amidohydrolase YtcJ